MDRSISGIMSKSIKNLMLGENWEQNRQLMLDLGTKEYQKPAQLAHSEVVYDTPKNRLTKAENYVEPVGNLASVYSDTMLNIWGLPLIKKGFRVGNNLVIRARVNEKVENSDKNQPSDLWVRNRLNCDDSYMTKNGYIVFNFKTFFVSLIQSIDPSFNETEIKEALYVTCDDHDDNGHANFSNGLIFAKTSEAAFNIEALLHKRIVGDFFPGQYYRLSRYQNCHMETYNCYIKAGILMA